MITEVTSGPTGISVGVVTLTTGEAVAVAAKAIELRLLCLYGRVSVTIENVSRELGAGDILAVPVQAPWAVECLDACKLLVMM